MIRPAMRFDLPDTKKLVHEMTIQIRWADMDALGHVNNVLYFRYFEMVRVEWLYSLANGIAVAGEGPVVINSFGTFLQQLKYPGSLLAKLYVANPGRTSYETYMTLERTDAPGVLSATGGAKVVWVNYREERSVPLPERMRRVIE